MWYNLTLAADCHIDMNNAHTHTQSNMQNMIEWKKCAVYICTSARIRIYTTTHNSECSGRKFPRKRRTEEKKFALEWKVFFIKFAIFQSKLPAYSYKLRNIFAVNFAFIWYMQHSFSRSPRIISLFLALSLGMSVLYLGAVVFFTLFHSVFYFIHVAMRVQLRHHPKRNEIEIK